MKMNLFDYTYKILYNSGHNNYTEMNNKQCNAGDPLETPGGLHRGPPSKWRIWCGVNRLGDRGVNRLGDNSAFVNLAGQL